MIFEGNITITGTSAKPVTKLGSKAFYRAKDVESATHIRLKGSNKFEEIRNDLIIKRKKDADGNPTDDVVHYSEINDKEEFVCVVNGEEHAIYTGLYTQIVLMNKSEKGNYLKCDDDVYVHKDEVQVPAFKKIALYGDVTIEKPNHDREFYVETEVIVLNDRYGTKITLPVDESRLRVNNGNNEYLTDSGRWVSYTLKRNLDTRQYFKHLLLDNEKIVDVSKLEEQANGDFVIKNVDGKDVHVGKKEIDLKEPFLEGEAYKEQVIDFIPDNLGQQRGRLQKQDEHVEYRKHSTGKDGILKFNIHKTRNSIFIEYADKTRVIYALEGTTAANRHDNKRAKLIWVRDFKFIDLGEQGIRVEFKQVQHDVAQNIIVNDDNKITSCQLNGRELTNISWAKSGGYDSIASYTIDGVKISDIAWEGTKIKTCKIHLINEAGEEVIKTVEDIYSSEYKEYAITQKVTSKIENVEIKDDKVSFKMGDYVITDAEFIDDNKIGNCKIKHDGVEEEINLSTDPRFQQLNFVVKFSLDQSRLAPLVRSRLMEKKNGKYELVADVVQTEEMKDVEYDLKGNPTEATKNNGVAKAQSLENVDQAVKAQEKFKDKPFKTVVIDQNNKLHIITDFNTTYESAADFRHDNEIVPDMIGKSKIEVKKGDLKIDSKKDDSLRDNTVVLGFALCSNPITLIFGIGTLFAGAVIGVAAPINRAIKQERLENKNPLEFKQEMQDNAAKHCKENINNMVAGYKRQLEEYKKMYSQEEFKQKAQELGRQFRYEYTQEIAKMQILGGGSIQCEFDPSKKTKLTPTLHLAYLEYMRKRNEFEHGKEDDPILASKLKEELADLTGEDRIEKRVELLQQYGGRKSQMDAYLLKLNNIDLFLEKENEIRAKNKQPIISREAYEKQLTREFIAGKAVWGSIDDKMESYQHSDEYIKADNKTRKKMLKDYREKLESDAKKIKINSISFEPRLDKNGKPVIEGHTRSAMAYLDVMEDMFSTGDTKKVPEFSFDFYDKLDSQQKERFTETQSLTEGTVRRINNVEQRRMAFDKEKSLRVSRKIEQVQQKLNLKISQINQEIEQELQTASYEDLVKLQVQHQTRIKNLTTAYLKSENLTDIIPYKELDEDSVKRIQQRSRDGQVSISKMGIQIEQAKQRSEKKYQKQVNDWSRADYIRQHQEEFKAFAKNGTGLSAEDSMKLFIVYMQRTHGKKAVADEMSVYRVKNNIQEMIKADVVCEQENAQFNAWVQQYNATNGTSLDANSDLAKSRYYVQRAKENLEVANQFDPNSVQFKPESVQAVRQRTQERLDNGTLVTSNDKQRNLDELTENISESLDKVEDRKHKKAEMAKKTRAERERDLKEKYEAHKKDKESKGYAPAPSREPAMTA